MIDSTELKCRQWVRDRKQIILTICKLCIQYYCDTMVQPRFIQGEGGKK